MTLGPILTICFLVFIVIVAVGALLLYWMNSCVHEWEQIDRLIYRQRFTGNYLQTELVFQCKHCKRIKKSTY